MKRIHYFTILVVVALLSGYNEVIAKLTVKPYFQTFDVVTGITMPNLIIIDGADADKVKLSVEEGPGKFYQRDGLWYWEWDETQRLDGQTYTVTYSASSNEEVVKGQFTVNVKPKQPVDPHIIRFFDEDGKPLVFTRVPTDINGFHQFLNGEYRIDISLDGKPYKSFNSPTCSFSPEFGLHEGKKMEVEIYYRSVFMKDFVLLESLTERIKPPPLVILDLPRRYTVGDPFIFRFKCFYGIEGYFSEGPAFLEVQSNNIFDGFSASDKQTYKEQTKNNGLGSSFEDEAPNIKDEKEIEKNFKNYMADADKLKWKGDFRYNVKIQNMPKNITKKGVDVNVVFNDPVTKQSVTRIVRFYPKIK